jgi:Zn-dependent metalloprotease
MKSAFHKAQRTKKVLQVITALSSGLGFVRSSAADVLRKFVWTPPRTHLARLPLLLKARPFESDFSRPLGLSMGAETVVRSTQRIGSATIAGTWVQTVYDSSGAPVYQSGEVLDSVPQDLVARVRAFESRRNEAKQSLTQKLAAYRMSALKFEPDIQLVHNSLGEHRLEFIFDFIAPDDTKAFEARLNESLELISVKERGSGAVVGLASVLKPTGQSTTLTEVQFAGMTENAADLQSHAARVFSAKAEQAHSPERIFRYDPSDVRFEQVQVYFYADQILSWFKARFDAEPKARLEIKVQVGDKSNTAFYFRNSVRLGSGDGIKYKQMAFDPTIVTHEIAHSIVDRYAALPSDGEGGAMNEAFADYFAAALWQEPKIGSAAYQQGPFIRSLENSETAASAFANGLYKASQVFSGALWDFRTALGPELGDTLAFRCLVRLGPGSLYKDFSSSVIAAAATLPMSPEQKNRIQEILLARGLQL